MRWKCKRCSSLVSELSQCWLCRQLVCNKCLDPFVGVCLACVKELFKGGVEVLRQKVYELSIAKLEENWEEIFREPYAEDNEDNEENSDFEYYPREDEYADLHPYEHHSEAYGY